MSTFRPLFKLNFMTQSWHFYHLSLSMARQSVAAKTPAKKAAPKPRTKLNLNKAAPSTTAKNKRAAASHRHSSNKTKTAATCTDDEMSDSERSLAAMAQ
jgi:hypothetical protein